MAAANRYRARAPSPKDFDSDNTYSLVQDSVRDRKMTQVARIDRMFGDSANEEEHFADKRPNVHLNNNKFGSVSSNSTNSDSLRGDGGGSLASLYQARKNLQSLPTSKKEGGGHYDAATVEQIKAQFQAQIEAMMLSQERNAAVKPLVANGLKLNPVHHNGPIKNGHIPSAAERELSGIKDIQRGKSFLEARTAVQKHIEKMLNNNPNNSPANSNQSPSSNGATLATETPVIQRSKLLEVKHTMHGVSHALPGDLDDVELPPPVHYGVDQAIRSGSVALKNPGGNLRSRSDFMSNESLTSIVKEPSLARPVPVQESVNLRVISPDLSPPKSPLSKKIIPIKSDDLPPINSKQQSNMTAPPSRNSSQTPTSPAPSALNKKEYVRHKVDYLGALPISASRSTNLAALQRPLKDLYFKWRALRNLGHSNLPGTLEINDNGLTVQYIRELHKGVQEIFNPFPTIAVWAAVKFVHRREVSEGGRMRHRFAFLPLISDPEGREKSRLFHDLDTETEVELAADAPHPPVFACVMRKQGLHSSQKQLECHGFVCNTSEDAIIIAANLYQALLETMKKQKARNSPKNRSIRRSRQDDSKSVSTYNGDSQASMFSDNSATTPIRPPRKKKKGRGGSGTDTSVPGSVLQRRKSVRNSNRSNRSIRNSRRSRGGPNSGPVSYNPSGPPSFVSDHPFRRSGQGLRRADSRGRGDFARRSTRRSSRRGGKVGIGKTPGFMSGNTANGDVYTRVAIPRSKSFMNVHNQYNLQELFKELKEKEGVESIDDVLKKVISPNGISFNEIKPVYRELLLKLAMTMSQDELFQRSKNIMSAEKKKSNTTKKKDKSSKKSYPVSASEQSTLSSFLKLTFSSNKHQNGMGTEKSSTFTKDSKKSISKTDISGPMPIHPPPSLGRKTPKTTRKATSPLPPPPSPPKIHPPSTQTKTKKPPIPTDDFIDDAYVSCSECYESVCNYDSCSGCSAPGSNAAKKIPPPKAYQGHVIKAQVHHHAENDSIHDCDTDSCISSEKCYCSLRKDPRSSAATTTPKLRPKLAPIPSDSDSCCGNHFTTSEMSDSATDTTCYSVRHVPIVKHNHSSSAHMSLSGAETPQTAWRRNSKSISNDISSDTYSDAGIMLNSSASSSGSCKMCEVHHKMHHHHTSDDDHSNLSRKNSGNSGGSGYQSNDSNCCSHHCGGSHSGSGSHSRPITSPSSIACSNCQCPTSACSSCQTSLAGSLMSTRRSRPKLSLPYSHSNINLSAAGLGSPMDLERSSRGRSSSPQKMLVVSAMDRSGKVRNNQSTREPPPLVRKLSYSARKVQELSARRDSEEDCKICDKQFKMRLMYSGSTHSNEHLNHSSPSHSSSSSSKNHHHNSMTSLSHNSNNQNDNGKNNDENTVMSMKKSAEIAAEFSGAKINQMTDIVDHNLSTEQDDFVPLHRFNRQQFSESNMHSSLGYFP